MTEDRFECKFSVKLHAVRKNMGYLVLVHTNVKRLESQTISCLEICVVFRRIEIRRVNKCVYLRMSLVG